VENTPFIVERYRQSAHALGYSGDSLVNSLGDSMAMGLGFGLAHVLPVRLSIATVVGVELFLAVMIHDNLTLNIFHLIRPDAAQVPGTPTRGGLAAGQVLTGVCRVSLESDARRFHHGGPLRRLCCDQRAELRRRSGHRRGAEPGEARLRVG